MKKKVFGAVALIAIAVAAGWNYQQNNNKVEMSDLTLENIEALASGEGGGGMTDCPNGCLTYTGICFCYGYQPYEEAKW